MKPYTEEDIQRFLIAFGYGGIITGLISILEAFSSTHLSNRIFWSISAIYVLVMGIGVQLRKVWGRKLISGFFFLLAVNFLIMIPLVSHEVFGMGSIVGYIAAGVIFVPFSIWMCYTGFDWIKSLNHPESKMHLDVYFNRDAHPPQSKGAV